MMRPLSKTQSLIVGLVLSSVLFAPSCKCGIGQIGGEIGAGGPDEFEERFTSYRGAAGNTITVCPGQSVLLGSLDFTDITYSWEPTAFLDDPTSARPTFTSSQPGNYIYTLTITDNQGRTVTSGVSAIVVPPPTAIIESDRPTVCAGGSLQFKGDGSFAAKGQSITSFAWDFNGDGTADSSEANPPAQAFSTVGTFPVALTVTDTLGCSGTETRNYPICDAPTATFGVTQQRVSESSGTVFINVNLDAPAPADVRIPIALSGTAVSADYTAPTEIVVPAGTTMGTAQITIIDDVLNESDETIVITLILGGGAKPGTSATHTITIADNDLMPVLIINDLAADEGAGMLTFTVTLSEPSGQVVTATYSTAGNTADCADVGSISGTLTFQPGETTKLISLPIVDDLLDEDDEIVLVTLANAVHATLLDTHAIGTGEQFGGRTPGTVYGIGTITDNDALPLLSVNDATGLERNPPPASSTDVTFSVSLNTASGRYVTVPFGTFDLTANAGSDYLSTTTGLLIFTPATHTVVGGVCTETSPAVSVQTLAIPIINNTTPEATETFSLDLNAPVNASLAKAIGIGTITDDDPKPLIVADSPYASASGSSLVFTVRLPVASQETVTVAYSTRDGTALAGPTGSTGYGAVSGTLSFLPGERTKLVTVPLHTPDTHDTFMYLSLSNPTAARVQAAQCFVGTILEGSNAPTYSIADTIFSESAGTARFTVVRAGTVTGTGAVDFYTTDGSAKEDIHYAPTTRTVTFAAGEVSKTVDVPILDDAALNPSLTFFGRLQNPVGGTISDNRATATIVDNDQPAGTPELVANDTTVLEDWGLACVTIVRSGVNFAGSTSTFATRDGTPPNAAVQPSDYAAITGTLIFDPLEAVKVIGIPIVHDTGSSELPERFHLDLTAPSGATLTAPTATITILDADGTPTFVISDAVVLESAGIAQVTVNLTGSHPQPVFVNFFTTNGTAVAGATGPTGADYTSSSATLEFTPFDFAKTLDIPINDDIIFELAEIFSVGLTGATGLPSLTIGDGAGTVTINDDDAAPTFAVTNVTSDESGALNFIIAISKQSQVPLSVSYATSNGTALSGATGPTGADYIARSGTANFAPYATQVAVTVTLNDDVVDEDNETMTLTLSLPSAPATISSAAATGTITDNDDPPTLSINSPTIGEGAGPLAFVATLSVPSAKTITVDYATSDTTAVAGLDYTSVTGTLTFPPGTTSRPLNVAVLDDAIFELTETLTVTLSTPTNATVAMATGTGTITETDSAPTISINDVAFNENDGASQSFTVTLSRASSNPFTVAFATANLSAVAGPTGDYVSTTGTLLFAAGETTKTIPITILNDTTDEAAEQFNVNLSTPVPAFVISDAQGLGTITDDDLAPTLSVGNPVGPEGASGTTGALGFVVSLSQASGLTVTVDYRTVALVNGATANDDYVTTTGTLTFLPGETTKVATVAIRGDNLDEPDENFSLVLCSGNNNPAASGCLTSPTNATISSGVGTGTIENDDTPPTVSINDRLNLTEGNSGTTAVQFTVTLSKPSGRTITVAYITNDGSAIAGLDYNTSSGTLTFAPNEVTKTISVDVRGDTTDEDTETFTVDLSNATNASLSDAQGAGSIADDDSEPTLTIADVPSFTEGSGGGVNNVTLTVTLSAQSGKPVTVSYLTQNGTALAGSDYTATGPLTLTFAPGITTQQLTVPIAADTLNEVAETFRVRLCDGLNSPIAGCTAALTNATISDGDATVTITDDDAQPALSIDDISVAEGPSGTKTATFTISLSTASGRDVTFNAQTTNGTAPDASATAPSDYVAFGPTGLTIPAGALTTTIGITINGDTIDENDETYTLGLTSVVGATVTKGTGLGTIANDDTLPQLSVNDVSFPESTGGNFVVSLSNASGRIVRVSYSTSSGTAISGTDFTGILTTVLTFNPGQTSLNVPITINNDVLNENDEDFTLSLSAPQNATINDGLGVGTIIDNDALPTLAINDVTAAEGTLGVGACTGGVTSTPFNFNVTLSPAMGSGRPVTVDYATANGPTGVTGALAGSDYASASGTLTFPVGSTGQTITVQVGCDSIFEDNQRFFVNLANALTGVSGTVVSISDNQGFGTINNDDNAPTIALDTNAAAVPEGAAIVLTATLSQTSEVAATIPFSVRQTTGNEPNYAHSIATGDYFVTQCTGVNAGPPSVPTGCSLTIPAGSNTASINLSARTDGSPDDGEEFTVRLCTGAGMPVAECTAPTAATPAAPASASVTITDNQLPVVTVSTAMQNVSEGVGLVTVTVQLDVLPSPGRNVTIPFSVSGTAIAGAGFDYTQGTASPLPQFTSSGSLTQNISFTIVNDSLNEAAETIIVTLGAPTNGTLGTPTVHTITIDPDALDTAPTLSINSIAVAEPDAGTAPGTLNVALSQPSGQLVTVQYISINGPPAPTGAVAPADYAAVPLSTMTFPVGTTGQTIPVTVAGDLLNEANETFGVILCRGVDNPPGIGCLAGPSNATITAPTGTVTINDNDPLPVLSVDSVQVNESDVGTVLATFTITLNAQSGRAVNVNYATANGPTGATGAVAPGDYIALPTTLVTFAPGEISKQVTVTVNGDLLDENDETFSFLLSNPGSPAMNATIVGGTGIGTILDNDALPAIAINDPVAVLEGTGVGTTNISFLASLGQPSGRVVTVQYTTTSGSATLGTDFTGPTGSTGTITFPVGNTGQTVIVPITRDSLDELSENFFVNLLSPTNATIGDAQGTGTITDDDNLTTVSIAPTGTTEGAASTTKQLAFTVSLNQASGRTISVTATPSSGGTATANTDYVVAPQVITFNPGETTKVFNVTINGDDLDEDNETFTVTLSGITGANPGTVSAIGTITDDDATPTLTINNPAAVGEGNSGTTSVVFTVTLASVSGRDVRFTYGTADGTATIADGDYAAIAPTGRTIPAGQTTTTITVTINGDTRDENNEDFRVNLSAAQTGATNDPVTITPSAQGTGTITDDDNPPELCIDDQSLTGVLTPVANAEGSSGSTGTGSMTFTVRMTAPGSSCATLQPSGLTVGANYATTNGSAIAGTDYTTSSGALSFPAGTTSRTFTVPITQDALDELNETFTATLSALTNASLGRATATGTITDDDNPPSLTISTPAAVAEGNNGATNTIIFNVSLSSASGQDVTVSYATADGTATTGDNDYTGKSGSLLFAAGGPTTQTISVTILGDVRFEPNQTFVVNLSSPVNATIATPQGTGTINNDDATPSLAVANVSLTEGNTGASNMTFTVSMTGIAGVPVTFNYFTTNGTAGAADFTAVGPTGATIPADTTSATFNVSIIGDRLWEGNEAFSFTINTPTNATISAGTATGTITDDETAPTVRFTTASTDLCEGAGGACPGYPVGPTGLIVELVLSGGTTGTQSNIVVPFTLSGTATSGGTDYTIAPTGSVTITAGTTSAALNISINNDSISEGNETAIITLGSPTPAGVATSAPSVHTLTIYDNDTQYRVTSAITLDSDSNGQIDMMRLVFDGNVDDSTFPAFAANGGGAQTAWSIATYTNVTLAYGTSVPTMYADVADDNTIYLRFTEKTTPDTAATPTFSNNNTPALLDLLGNGVAPATNQASIDGAPPVIMTAIAESGLEDLAVTFSEPVQSTGTNSVCASPGDNIQVSADLGYGDIWTGDAAGVSQTSGTGVPATDLNGCDGVITIKSTPAAFSVNDIFRDTIFPQTSAIYDLASPTPNAALSLPTTISGIVHPYLLSAVSTSSTTVQITFSRPVGIAGGASGTFSALNYATYTLVDPNGNCDVAIALDVATPIVQNSPNVFTLKTRAQRACSYLITARSTVAGGIIDLENASYMTDPKSATFNGNEQFRVTGASCIDGTHIRVDFNKPYATTGNNSALLASKYLLPRALGPVSATGPVAPMGVSGSSGSTYVILEHERAQCGNTYTVIAANTDRNDGFFEPEGTAGNRPIRSNTTPVQDMQTSPNDRAFFSGCGVQICGPLLFDPFADQSAFGSLANYNNRVYVGPNKTGNTAARFEYDGTQTTSLTFRIERDTNNTNSSTSRNAANTAPLGPTGWYETLGRTGCTPDSSNPLSGCGPDDEDGRGIFNVATLRGTPYLIAAGTRSATAFRYFYMTSDITNLLNYSYVDMGTTGHVVGTACQGASSIGALDDRQFVGYARGQPRRPDFSKISFNIADANYCTAGASCDITTTNGVYTQAERMWINNMENFGNCPVGDCGTAHGGGNNYGLPISPNGAYYQGIDSMVTISNRIYMANGGHTAINRDGAIIRSTSLNPLQCREDIRNGCTTAHPSGTPQWVEITPRTNPRWNNGGVTGATNAHFSLELTKISDLTPGDRAYPQWATFNGKIFVARNVCRTGNSTVPTNNTPGNTAALATSVDMAVPTATDGVHNAMFTNCINGDSAKRAQLWKCDPTLSGSATECDANEWSLIDGGGTFLTDGYTSFGNPATNGNRTLSLLVANGDHLYVGFDNPTTGLQIWRTNTANPTNEDSNWTQYSVSGLTDSNNLPDSANQRYIYSAISAQDTGGTNYVYVATGRTGYPISIFRIGNF